jgi:hypothetical protein
MGVAVRVAVAHWSCLLWSSSWVATKLLGLCEDQPRRPRRMLPMEISVCEDSACQPVQRGNFRPS